MTHVDANHATYRHLAEQLLAEFERSSKLLTLDEYIQAYANRYNGNVKTLATFVAELQKKKAANNDTR